MAHNDAIEVLFKEKNKLEIERDFHIDRLNKLISDLETSIEVLSGKKVWEVENAVKFDDENPDYIKSSKEEI